MKYLNSLEIESLKGVRNLSLRNLASINIITGPNSSGKSTVLDAAQLIVNPTEPMQFMKIANHCAEQFCNLFDKGENRPRIRVCGELLGKLYSTELISYESLNNPVFQGYHSYGIPKNNVLVHQTKEVNFSWKDSPSKKTTAPLVTVKRITKDCISPENISKDKIVKEKVLSFLSLFDNRFTDIYSPDFVNTYFTHEVYGNLNASFFSDGIRSILSIASAMAGFQHGILLIEDLEAKLAPKTLYEGVNLLYSLAKSKQIQLFISTHSQELIDEFLDLLHFYEELSNLTIIRLKSNGIHSLFTQYSGKEAYELRLEQEIDFRYEYLRKGAHDEGIF